MSNNNCSILINSCDGYEDIWTPFFSCFKSNWSNCPYKIFLNTEHKNYVHEGLEIFPLNVVKEEKVEWGERLLDCLSRITTEYVIMLFDDFCLEKEVNQIEIEKCIHEMENDYNIDAFYLINIFPELVDRSNRKFIEIPLGKEYRLNSAPGVWRKSSLIKYTGKIDTPWAWEYFGSFRTKKQKKSKIYTLNGMADLYPYNYSIGGAIHRGKWVKSVIEPINEKYNLHMDFSKRGFTDETNHGNSIWWLIKFTFCGCRMIGPTALIYFKYIHPVKALVKKVLSFFGITIKRHPLRLYKER